MKKGYLSQIHPVLPVKDVAKALTYYTTKLGFKIAFSDFGDDPKYAGVKRDGIEIHLQWHDETDWEASIDRPMLRIVTEQVEDLFNEYKKSNVFHEKTNLKTTPWRTKEFAFYDIYKNGLTFYTDI